MLRSALISLCLFGIIASGLVVCPSEDGAFNFIFEDLEYEGCETFSVPAEHLPFLVKLNPSTPSFVSDEKIKFFPLEYYPGFVLVIAPESAAQELDMLLLGLEHQLVSYKNPHMRPVTKIPKISRTALKDDIVNRINGSTYYTEMEKITGEVPIVVNGNQYTIKTRYTFTQSNKNVAAYFLQRFRDMGLEASYQTFRYSGTDTQNIIAIKRGTSSDIVVVGAHMDSISQDPNNLAPGCIDNGSGAEGVMQIAAAFARENSAKTIHFILFGAEEQGLIGSNYYVDNRRNNGYNVVYSLIMDMIGYSNTYFGLKIETSSSAPNRELSNLMQTNMAQYSPSLSVTVSTNYFGSDHVPFIDDGIPCFLAIERDDVDYVGYHRTTDRVNYLSVDQSVGILRGMAATLYDLAF